MPVGGTYTIDTADMAAWRPGTWYCYSMPAGGTYTIDTRRHGGVAAWHLELLLDAGGWHVHHRHRRMAAWRPGYWYCYSMPVGAVTVSAASDFAGWISTTTIRADNNGLLQAAVDAILSGCWSAFATRTATGGTINVGGTNAAPSGVLQAANPPTTGKEFAYELANDSQNVNPTKKWTTITITT